MTFAHGGNLGKLAHKAHKDISEILDFSASINPLGPPERTRQVISRNIELLRHYPDPDSLPLIGAIADDLGVEEEQIVLGNGSTEIIYAIPRAFPRKKAVIPIPSYNDYTAAAHICGLEIVPLPLSEESNFSLNFLELAKILSGDEIVFLGQPNNPTGRTFSNNRLFELADSFPDTIFAVDESFADFVPGYKSVVTYGGPNLIMVRSLTKFFAIPGLRLGYGCSAAKKTARLKEFILPWSVNTLAQAVGTTALQDKGYYDQTRSTVAKLRHELEEDLVKLPLTIYPSETNFLLIRINHQDWTARVLAEKLLEECIAIRVCENFTGLPGQGSYYFRLAVRTREENQRLIQGLQNIFHRQKITKPAKKTFSLMLQGTTSNAGKSVLTAALCRILLQDGYRIAPFKAQNMSLNSFVTREGLEMGRAQVVQAQACCLDPDVRMNPILLKPSSEVGSQVIVNGRPVANMTVNEYIGYKPTAWKAAQNAYDELAAAYDGVILEGAGSPGEVNLKHHDIVNMRMASYAKSPVLLVGDIDRGGLFASFVGIMEVLAEWERALIAGFIVNRFRGQQSLLDEAFRYTERHTGRPVLGVVPNLSNLGLPEEDSVSFKAGLYDSLAPAGDYIEIGLIDLPHISNFTDFEPFLAEPDVFLRIIRTTAELEAVENQLAAVLLPGSKNVMNDLEFLTQSGLADRLCTIARKKQTEVIGICGGFQMLGRTIADPHGLESGGKNLAGLALLDIETSLEMDKTLIHRTATHAASGFEVHGYEIHHGRTTTSHRQVLECCNGQRICAASDDNMTWGTYLHGIFDADDFRRWFIDRQRIRKGLSPAARILAPYDLEAAMNRLAATVRQGLDMEHIYRLLEL